MNCNSAPFLNRLNFEKWIDHVISFMIKDNTVLFSELKFCVLWHNLFSVLPSDLITTPLILTQAVIDRYVTVKCLSNEKPSYKLKWHTADNILGS